MVCLGNNNDGTVSLRAWGTGKDVYEAIYDAKKRALNQIIFEGITAGSESCGVAPLILEVNARENNEALFNSFFSDKELMSKFITITEDNLTIARKSQNQKSKLKIKSTFGVAHYIGINLNKSELHKYFKSKGI